MVFIVRHRLGETRRDPPVDTLARLLDELNDADDEHFDVSVSDETGWTLTAYANGNVVWEDVEDDARPRHLRGMSRAKVLDLFKALATGDIATVEREKWLPGYPR